FPSFISGFPVQRLLQLSSNSPDPVRYEIRIDKNGRDPALTFEDYLRAPSAGEFTTSKCPREFLVEPSSGVIQPGRFELVKIVLVSNTICIFQEKDPSAWTVSPMRGLLNPDSSLTLTLSVNLNEAKPASDSLIVHGCYLDPLTVKLMALGVGFSILTEPNILPSYDFGESYKYVALAIATPSLSLSLSLPSFLSLSVPSFLSLSPALPLSPSRPSSLSLPLFLSLPPSLLSLSLSPSYLSPSLPFSLSLSLFPFLQQHHNHHHQRRYHYHKMSYF
ncbi:hypothetical protein WDU94_007738, partial [Cyamophila willieti]